jgi:hypothetical protein
MSLSRSYPAVYAKNAKVFWFFFSKKNFLLRNIARFPNQIIPTALPALSRKLGTSPKRIGTIAAAGSAREMFHRRHARAILAGCVKMIDSSNAKLHADRKRTCIDNFER